MSNTNSRTYPYPRPSVAVDAVVLGLGEDSQLHALLIERGIEPFQNRWALPGGFVRENEALDKAVERELAEETGLTKAYIEQLYTFGAPERDPRTRVISVSHLVLVRPQEHVLDPRTDAKRAAWFSVFDVPSLAFDHDEILRKGVERLRNKIRYAPLAFELLGETFTLSEVQKLYEHVLQKPLDKRNFRKRLLASGAVQETDAFEEGVAHRAARLYRRSNVKSFQL